jgi:hypothetical protein
MLELCIELKTRHFFPLLPLPFISFVNARKFKNAVFDFRLILKKIHSSSLITSPFIPNPHQLPHHYEYHHLQHPGHCSAASAGSIVADRLLCWPWR